MKKMYSRILFFVVIVILALSFKKGVTKKGHDKTGSPLSDGRCTNCHSAGKYNVSLDMKIFDGDTAVQNYTPGHRYKLKFRIKHSGNPSKYGFQVTALDKDNKTGGKFENVPSKFVVRHLRGVDYIDHSSPANVEFLNVDWIAPSNHVGDITVYFGGIAANGNGSTSGDGAAVDSFKIVDGTSGAIDLNKNENQDLFELNNNISSGFISLVKLKYPKFAYRIISRNGRVVEKASVEDRMDYPYYIDINSLDAGLYFVQLFANGEYSSKSFVVLP